MLVDFTSLQSRIAQSYVIVANSIDTARISRSMGNFKYLPIVLLAPAD